VVEPNHTSTEAALKQAEELRDLVLREYVLRYLARHPGAMDTLKGIAEWWITREQLMVDVQRLSRVLTELTRTGVLDEIGSGDGRMYRLRAVPRSSATSAGGSA